MRAAVGALLLVMASSAPMPAQSLADAAKAAEEQRKAQTKPSIVITTAPGGTFHEALLTEQLVGSFSNARRSLSRLYAFNPTIYETVRAGSLSVRRYRDFAKVLASEPKIVETLQFFGFDPDSFVIAEISIRNSLTYAKISGSGDNDVERQNGFFACKRQLEWAYHSWQLGDQGRAFWPENAIYW